ncbi:MAG: flagellar hook basal-body protein [Phycisphaerae bacterium]|nr:flagellar hook basal-body protein [Phycisphaerae bacterium]
MSDSMSVTASDLGALTRQYESITHNLANADTVGFKRQISQFRRVMNQLADDGDLIPGSQHIGHHVANKVQMDFTQGVLKGTGRPLDVAIHGEGAFFVLETDQGPLYSRNGSLHLTADGKLVDAAERQIAGQNGQITLPSGLGESQIQIGQDGTISAGGNAVGKIKLVEVEDLTQLRPAGSGCYRLSVQAKTKPAEKAKLQQGFLETSNVDAVEELVKLIQVSRLYEAGVKTIASQDERLQNLMRVAQG